jgi:endonuclease/exonuclease/phosphatase (EEP) superfamily protein YafD
MYTLVFRQNLPGYPMVVTLGIATLVLLLVTLLPLSHSQHWVVRAMDFPRMQFASLAALLLAVQLLFLHLENGAWVLVLATIFCLFWQLWWIAPYTLFYPKEVDTEPLGDLDRSLRVMTANVLMTNRNAEALLTLVNEHQPDVLVTLESDQWWQHHLDTLQPEMPHTIKCPQDNLYGMHVYSRLPLHEIATVFLVEDDVPSMHAQLQLRTGEPVRMHFLHPAPPSPTENHESAERDAELVIVARSIDNTSQPVIVTGDLNDVAWSETTRLFRKLSGLLDPRVGRGMFNTFHAHYPFLRWPLDHIFHSSHFSLVNIQRLPAIGSDHFPLLTELSFTPSKANAENGLQTDAGDESRADFIAQNENSSQADVPSPGGETSFPRR